MRDYTRVDLIRNILDSKIKLMDDEERKRCAYVHLYGVGLCAAILAFKRGRNREYAELCEVAGMLHDLYKFMYCTEDDHAHKGAILVDGILKETMRFTVEEIDMIVHAVYHHSDKDMVHGKKDSIDEILKDADDMQHFFRNPVEDYWNCKDRLLALFEELSLGEIID